MVALVPTERVHAGPAAEWIDEYREPAKRLIAEATADTFAWRRLAVLTDSIGHRLSGSPELDRAIAWAVAEMKRDGLENVHTEKVWVPKWVRGRESAEIIEPNRRPLAMLGLGNGIGTPHNGIQAEVVIVHSFDELDVKAADVKGRIVFFNVPFRNDYVDGRFYRAMGPSKAARYGAVAMLIRSIGPPGQRIPHTGNLQYAASVPQVPAAAVASEDADRLQRIVDRGGRLVVRLQMEAHFEPDVESANVIGELRGREKPHEIVVVGGHLDSWDVGDGALDDGGGCIVTWEALRILKKLGMRPRRTIRLVLWTNEENGTRGGQAYRDAHRSELADHVLMFESDTGVLRPTGFGFTGNTRARNTVATIAAELLRDIANEITPDGEGADVAASVRDGRIPAMALNVSGNYFAYHHTEADTVDKIDPVEMARCAAAVTVMAYVVADMRKRLGE